MPKYDPQEFFTDERVIDALKAGGETAFSMAGNAFFDLGSLGATAVSNPWTFAKAFLNKSAAEEFGKLESERRSQLPELDVTPRTEEIHL